MTKSLQPVVFPKNNEELNTLINGMNKAYGKYFGLEVSDARSNKLRDCICEGVGFTNGAYQQLKSQWELSDSTHCQVKITSLHAKPSRTRHEHHAYFGDWMSTGNCMPALQLLLGSIFPDWTVGDELTSVYMDAPKKTDFPIRLFGKTLGYADNSDDAALFSAALAGLYYDNNVPVLTAQINLPTDTEEPSYLLLRQSSKEMGLCIPFTRVQFLGERIVVQSVDHGEIEVLNNPQNDTYTWAGVSFDFLIAYSCASRTLTVSATGVFNVPERRFSVKYGRAEPSLTHRAGVYELECLPVNSDIDDAVIMTFSKTEPLYLR